MFVCLQVEAWEDKPRVISWARRKYNSLIQTQIVEDGFQRERAAETRSATKSFNSATAWHTLIKKNILGKVHNFKNSRLQPFRRGVHKSIDKKTIYHPRSVESSCNLSKVMGDGASEATWWTCNSSTWNKPFAHLVMQRYCLVDEAWPNRIRSVSLCWLCCLFNRAPLLVRRCGTNKWFFTLGTLAEVVGIGWPAAEVKNQAGDVVGYLPEKHSPENARDLIQYLPVTKVWPADQSEYEAMAFTAQGPMARACTGQTIFASCTVQPEADIPAIPGSKPEEKKQMCVRGIIAVPEGEAKPLIEAAARICFMEWGITLLKQLAQHIGADLAPKDKLFEVLTKLLQMILHPLEEDDLLDILSRREFKKDPMDAILSAEEMVELQFETGMQGINEYNFEYHYENVNERLQSFPCG